MAIAIDQLNCQPPHRSRILRDPGIHSWFIERNASIRVEGDHLRMTRRRFPDSRYRRSPRSPHHPHNHLDSRVLPHGLFGNLVFVEEIKGSRPLNQMDLGVTFTKKHLQTACSNHYGRDVWIDSKHCHEPVAMKKFGYALRSHATCSLVVVEDIGEFFSRGLDRPITGTMSWMTVATRFFLQAGQKPDLIRLNLVVQGKGRVWIDDVHLVRETPPSR